METIFVIEDDKEVRTSLVDLLGSCGYTIFSAENGRDALDKIKVNIPDLVISDIMMPDLNGLGLLQKLRAEKETAAIPFIFLTAKTEYADIRLGITEGADDYLVKPFKAKDLLNAVRTRLNKKIREQTDFKNFQFNISSYIPKNLGAPLVTIKGFAELIVSDVDKLNSDEIIEYAKNIIHSTENLSGMLHKYYTFTQSIYYLSNKEEYNKTKFDTVRSVKELISLVVKEKQPLDKNVSLPQSNTDFQIHCNKKFLNIILSELLDNAIKFSKPAQSISIETYKNDKEMKIEIINYGKHIHPTLLSELNEFNLFKNFDNTENYGLGLIIVRNLLHLIGGKLEILNEADDKIKIHLIFQPEEEE